MAMEPQSAKGEYLAATEWGVFDGLKILIAHDWILSWAGSEQAVLQMLSVFQHARVIAAFVDPQVVAAHLPQVHVHELWPGRLPGAHRCYQWLLPLEAVAFAGFPTSDYDVVLSSSHAFSKAVRAGKRGIHVCYCHTPPRYLWDEYQTYYDRATLVRQVMLRTARGALKVFDRLTTRSVSHFLTNSHFVARRIRRHYGRTARVIYGPVVPKIALGNHGPRARSNFLLYFGRLVPYKRVDLVVAAANRMQLPTVIAGDGPELRRLQAMAGPTVQMVGPVTDAEAAELLNTCAALVFCATEDFGLVPLEANAHGAPVIALRAGGVVDTLTDGETAIFFDEPTVDSLCSAIRRGLARSWDDRLLRSNAERFSAARFRERFARAVLDALEGMSW
jgi:glycosyltransferase involved in cell wall biosynthesis